MLQNASAPDVWELDYDARFAALAAFYTRRYHDTSAFLLNFWRGAMEEAAAEYSRFWSRSAGAMRAYVAAKTECEPWPQALKSLEWEQTAVVHFRCSDVPFISVAYAHLQSLQYAEWAGEQLAKRGVRQIQPLLCTYYANTRDESKASRKTALAQTKCPEFLAAYTESMRKGYHAGAVRNSVEDKEVELRVLPAVCVGEKASQRAMAAAKVTVLLSQGTSFGFIGCVPKGRNCISPWVGNWDLAEKGKKEKHAGDSKAMERRAAAIVEIMPFTMSALPGLPHPGTWETFTLSEVETRQ